ncbi:hypothetical protein [Candidatus Nitrospira inopinata]|jgi:glycogen debranching enzyme|nr:hypothetical protein [Candidatus Nitrospira inopinata]
MSLMTFNSILFQEADGSTEWKAPDATDFFHDLNLDQIVRTITKGWEHYDLTTFFRTTLNDLDRIAYCQEVMKDLEDKTLMQAVRSFSQRMRAMRQHLDQAKRLSDKHEKEGWFLAAVELYCGAVERLSQNLARESSTRNWRD